MTLAGIKLPTKFRHLSDDEWRIVTDVFEDTVPYQMRVLIANGIGMYNTPFTVPTSVISSALVAAGISNPLLSVAGIGGLLTTPVRAVAGVGAGYALSVVNAGFVINVGDTWGDPPEASYPDLFQTQRMQDLLVHEMTHVWQGKNNVFALSATLGSLAAQCKGMASSGGFEGRDAAYKVTLTTPLAAWGSFNPEQQAWVVERWYHRGKDQRAKEFPYIRDYLRKGKTS